MARTIGSSGAKTLEAIRREGLRLIAEHGYEGMSLRDLAQAVGLRQGSLYNHIETKQALLFGLVAEHMDKLLAELDRALAGIEGHERRLEAFVAFHVRYHMVRRFEVFVVNSELRSLDPENYAAIVAMRRAYERRLSDILAAGIAAGAFTPSDPQVTAFAILALATGVVAWYRPGGRLSEDEIVATHVGLAMAGVGVSRAAR